MFPRWRILLLFTWLITTTVVAEDKYATIHLETGYVKLRTCARPALGRVQTVSQVWYIIGCGPPWLNSYYCLGMNDFATPVTSFFKLRKSDVGAVISWYDRYCSDKGCTHPVANVKVPTGTDRTTNAGATVATSVRSVAISTVYYTTATTLVSTKVITRLVTEPVDSVTGATITPGSGSDGSSSKSSLALSDKIALGVGLGIGLPSLMEETCACVLNCHRFNA